MDEILDVAIPPSEPSSAPVDLPAEWLATFWGGPVPDVVSIIRRHRDAAAEPAERGADDADRT
jgi:hypothetical protein